MTFELFLLIYHGIFILLIHNLEKLTFTFGSENSENFGLGKNFGIGSLDPFEVISKESTLNVIISMTAPDFGPNDHD